MRIAPAGFLKEAAATERIDAKGLVVCPGFIDIQSHSREALLTGDGRVVSKVTQGVTTEIMGEGWSNAPANERTIAFIRSDEPGAAKIAAEFTGPHGFDAWLLAMKRHGSSVNFGSFVGSATVRAYVKGMDQGVPSNAELESMRGLVRHAMEDGAFGLASALIYPPDNFVARRDLIELAKVMAPFGGVYISHIRSEADHLLEAIDEAIEIGREGGVPVEIYHLKAAGRRNWPKAAAAVARIAAARERGLDVGADMYPYVAGSTGLAAILPPFASAGDRLFERLADPAERTKIRAEVLDQKTEWESMGMLAAPENILILGLEKPANKKYVGKRLAAIAQAEGKHWLDAAMDLILSEHKSIGTVYFMMSEENVRLQLQQPWMKFGTDAEGIDPEHASNLAHPRAYGTYPRILGKYVRDEKVIPLEEAIRKMTSAVAERLSIRDRGQLAKGSGRMSWSSTPRRLATEQLTKSHISFPSASTMCSLTAPRSCTRAGTPEPSPARSSAGPGIGVQRPNELLASALAAQSRKTPRPVPHRRCRIGHSYPASPDQLFTGAIFGLVTRSAIVRHSSRHAERWASVISWRAWSSRTSAS